MKIIFSDPALETLYLTETTRNRKYKKLCKKPKLVKGYVNAVNIMRAAVSVNDLSMYSYLRYERLKYNFSGLSSVRLANGYVERLIFRESEDGIEVKLIEIDDTHYGNKK